MALAPSSVLMVRAPFMANFMLPVPGASQDEVGHIFRDENRWTRLSILSAARLGKFSSDRAIREYSEQIWKVKPL